ncbi:response regulator, partial [Wenyingzhuangia sp. 1_MG-2023]|nr:response regulator [Wenyingzhuangia sp. 1_MG-2023]
HMPVLDGLAACREIRQREQQQQLPAVLIVALSADVMVDRKEECEAAGMNGYLAKPVRLEDLRRELPMFLALSNNDLGPAAVTPDS